MLRTTTQHANRKPFYVADEVLPPYPPDHHQPEVARTSPHAEPGVDTGRTALDRVEPRSTTSRPLGSKPNRSGRNLSGLVSDLPVNTPDSHVPSHHVLVVETQALAWRGIDSCPGAPPNSAFPTAGESRAVAPRMFRCDRRTASVPSRPLDRIGEPSGSGRSCGRRPRGSAIDGALRTSLCRFADVAGRHPPPAG